MALDAVTGKLLWKFDSGVNADQPTRGVAYWTDGKDGRILAGVMNYLYALDPGTGRPILHSAKTEELISEQIFAATIKFSQSHSQRRYCLQRPHHCRRYDAGDASCPPGDIRAFDIRTTLEAVFLATVRKYRQTTTSQIFLLDTLQIQFNLNYRYQKKTDCCSIQP